MTDIRQTSEYARHLKNLGWHVERLETINYFVRIIPIIGAIIKIQRPKYIDFNTISSLSTKYKVFQTIIEPLDNKQVNQLESRGYKLTKSPYLPSKTLILTLANKAKVINNYKKNTRHAIKKAKNVNIVQDPSIKSFHESWKSVAGFSRYVPSISTLESLKTALGTRMTIFTSHNDMGKKELYSAGSIFLLSDDTAYYWLSFASQLGRTTLSQYALVNKGILWAIDMGMKYFDFEGVFDNRFPNKSWLGFSHFKQGFGGNPTYYPGAYTKTDFLRRGVT